MNHLLIDVGNTRIKWLLLNDASEVIAQEQPCNAVVHEGGFDVAVQACFSEVNFDDFQELQVAISNVAGSAARQAIDSFFSKKTNCKLFYAEVARDFLDFHNKYERLHELGVDRWVALIGARQLMSEKGYSGSIIVVNCGTAITVDLLSESNVFEGGAILPGFDLALSALSKADGIARFELSKTDGFLGNTTKDCVQLGVLSSCVGGVEKIIADILSSFVGDDKQESADINIVVSGGAAPLFLSASSLKCIYDASLIFRGLKKISAS